MKVTIINFPDCNPEPEALVKAFERAVAFGGTGDDNIVEIICNRRGDLAPDWLEYHLSFKHAWGGQRFLIVMIQRRLDAAFEFHS